jgi:hypothetical protein
MTESEWKSVVRVALALQRTDPEIVERALIVYMIIETFYRQSGSRIGAWTKPMLILRVMFDIPDDPVIFDPVMPELRVAPCGGFSYILTTGEIEKGPSLALPVLWTDSGPSLRALRPQIGGGTRTYQPQVEYRYFLTHFRYREDLQSLVDTKVTGWTSLMHLVNREEE